MKKVITYGTFDLFHKGHYNILKRAREYGDYLIVGVTGESYDIGRGKLSVKDNIATRIENVKATGLVDAIIIEEYIGQKISDIIKYDIDTLVIGDDWRGKFDHLKKYCNVVYLERTKNISSTQLRQENYTQHDIGIITDKADDNQLIMQAKLVSGFYVDSFYTEDESVRKEFAEKYNIKCHESVENIVRESDILYIHTAIEQRFKLIKKAIIAGKHVIADPPFSLNTNEQEELFKLAKENNTILIDNVKMVYLKVFHQLLWMTQGGLIGDIVSFNCSVSKQDKSVDDLFYGLMAMALCPMIKIMGLDYEGLECKLSKKDGRIEFGSLRFEYPDGEANINVGNSIRVENKMEIIGTTGTIRLKDNWWKANYFELDSIESEEKEIYSMNFEGNGFKFLIKDLSTMLYNGKIESKGLFPEESIKITKILEELSER